MMAQGANVSNLTLECRPCLKCKALFLLDFILLQQYSCSYCFTDRALAKGTVIAADLIPLDPIPGATILSEADLLKPEAAERILELLDGRPVDAVLSDMAPSASGVKELDHDRIVALAYCSVLLSLRVLSVGGSLLYKIWDGRQAPKLVEDVSRFFEYVNFVKPRASRGDSAEIFVLGRQFKGAERIPAGDTIA